MSFLRDIEGDFFQFDEQLYEIIGRSTGIRLTLGQPRAHPREAPDLQKAPARLRSAAARCRNALPQQRPKAAASPQGPHVVAPQRANRLRRSRRKKGKPSGLPFLHAGVLFRRGSRRRAAIR